MEESFIQNPPVSATNLPNYATSVSEMDISMGSICEADVSMNVVTQEQHIPQAPVYLPTSQTTDISMDTCADMSVDNEEGPFIPIQDDWASGPESNNESDKENAVEMTILDNPSSQNVSMYSECSTKIDSPVLTSSSKSPHLHYCSSEAEKEVIEQVSHEVTMESDGEVECRSTSSTYSKPFEEWNLIRPRQVLFDDLLAIRQKPPTPAGQQVLTSEVFALPTQAPLSRIVVTAGRKLPSISSGLTTNQVIGGTQTGGRPKREEFSFSITGKSGLSSTREYQLSRNLSAVFDFFQSTANEYLKEVKNHMLPVVSVTFVILYLGNLYKELYTLFCVRRESVPADI